MDFLIVGHPLDDAVMDICSKRFPGHIWIREKGLYWYCANCNAILGLTTNELIRYYLSLERASNMILDS